jgi:hypothetical protein
MISNILECFIELEDFKEAKNFINKLHQKTLKEVNEIYLVISINKNTRT